MSAIIYNIKRLFFQHIKSNLLILLNMILSTAAIFILLQNYYYLSQQYKEMYGTTAVAKNYQVSVNNFDMEQFQNYQNDLVNKSPMYYVGQKVIEELESNYDLTFYYSCSSTLFKEDMDNSELFDDFFEYEELGDYYYININLMDSNAIKTHNFSLLDGEWFSEEDYSVDDLSKPMNAVMGYEYSKIFTVGDTFNYKDDIVRIIGFLEKDTVSNEYGIPYSFDKSMIFPQAFPRCEENNILPNQFMYLYCGDDKLDVQEAINSVTTKCGYYTLVVSPMDGIQISSTKDISEKNVKLIGILALVACTICALSLASILVNRTLQDRDIYCIYLCCGIPMWKINLSITIEMIIYLTLSLFPTIGISIREYNSLLVPLWQIILFTGSITLISLIPTFITNKKCNIDLLIRNKII